MTPVLATIRALLKFKDHTTISEEVRKDDLVSVSLSYPWEQTA